MTSTKRKRTATTVVIDKNAALSNGARAAGDYNNDTGLDILATAQLIAHWDTAAPAAGAAVAELYLLVGDGDTTELIPKGGDGTVGNDADPQAELLIARITTSAPSISVDDIMGTPGYFDLGVGINRFVIKNISGQTFNLTWELRITTSQFENV